MRSPLRRNAQHCTCVFEISFGELDEVKKCLVLAGSCSSVLDFALAYLQLSINVLICNTGCNPVVCYGECCRIPDSVGKDIEKICQSIYPLHDVYVRKVKILKKPKFDRKASVFSIHVLECVYPGNIINHDIV